MFGRKSYAVDNPTLYSLQYDLIRVSSYRQQSSASRPVLLALAFPTRRDRSGGYRGRIRTIPYSCRCAVYRLRRGRGTVGDATRPAYTARPRPRYGPVLHPTQLASCDVCTRIARFDSSVGRRGHRFQLHQHQPRRQPTAVSASTRCCTTKY